MPGDSLTDRVERLEKADEGRQTLPEEVAALGERVGSLEGHVSELRTEMRQEFAAVRTDMQEGFASARDEMLVGLADVTSELGRQIQEATDEGMRHTQTLFEEALSRIAILGEQREGSPGRKPRAPRPKR